MSELNRAAMDRDRPAEGAMREHRELKNILLSASRVS
jgi:hypothetical protein